MKKVIVEIASNENYVPAYGERVSWEVVYRTEGRNFSNGILYAKDWFKKYYLKTHQTEITDGQLTEGEKSYNDDKNYECRIGYYRILIWGEEFKKEKLNF